MKQINLLLLFLLSVSIITTSCEEGSTYEGITGLAENLPELSAPYEYAAWIRENSNTRLMGNVTSINGEAQFAFAPIPETIRDASSITITIENSLTAYSMPSKTVIATASFGGSDEATFVSPLATQLENRVGNYILDSPTTTSSSVDNSGLWFVKDDISQGLELPVLSEGWKYEGWVNFNTVAVSTGKFLDPGAADEIEQYGGSEDPYPYPGEDFNNPASAPSGLNFPTDLKSKIVKVTLEPNPDDGETPFGITLFSATIPNPSVVKTTLDLEVIADQLAKGVVRKEKAE